jgi:hypothetical protein
MASFIKEYSSFVADINLLDDHPSTDRRKPSKIEVITAGGGTLVVNPNVSGNAAYDCVLTNLAAGFVLAEPMHLIRVGTNVALVRVWWD